MNNIVFLYSCYMVDVNKSYRSIVLNEWHRFAGRFRIGFTITQTLWYQLGVTISPMGPYESLTPTMGLVQIMVPPERFELPT